MLQNIIALIFDCDKTLSPVYMQEPIFHKYGVKGEEFWNEKDEMVVQVRAKGITLDEECAWMNLMLRYVREGRFKGLSNAELRRLGGELPFFAGLPDFFTDVKQTIADEQRFKAQGISLEYYVISTGLKEMIAGSALGEHLSGIFASEFNEDENGVISEIARALGYAKKTEIIYWLNKGGNVNPAIDVNCKLRREFRRIPIENMIYVGDGPTDVPCFATVNKQGGMSLAVYDPNSNSAFEQAYSLREQGRVFDFGPADFTPQAHIPRVIKQVVREIAKRIVRRREEEILQKIGLAPGFVAPQSQG
ncbi:MAG: haloacid dehalogenase-like hydrolase [Nanoarchaeota archaeon]